MDLSTLRTEVGADRFDAACDWAWRTAAGTGNATSDRLEWPDDLSMVPHDLDDFWWDDLTPPAERLRVGLELYRAMPCYWNAVHPYSHRESFDETTREAWWAACRELLDQPDDRLADPVGYCLWVEWFEDRSTRDEAWAAVIAGDPTDRRLERILPLSGPVAWSAKSGLYWHLSGDARWDVSLARAVMASAGDVYGEYDPGDAHHLRRRIGPIPSLPGWEVPTGDLPRTVRRPWWRRRSR